VSLFSRGSAPDAGETTMTTRYYKYERNARAAARKAGLWQTNVTGLVLKLASPSKHSRTLTARSCNGIAVPSQFEIGAA
jgi:hypothetical protein